MELDTVDGWVPLEVAAVDVRRLVLVSCRREWVELVTTWRRRSPCSESNGLRAGRGVRCCGPAAWSTMSSTGAFGWPCALRNSSMTGARRVASALRAACTFQRLMGA